MNQKTLTLIFAALFYSVCVFSQDSTKVKTEKHDLTKINESKIDSIIDGKIYDSKTIPAANDSLNVQSLTDLKMASEFDQKWLDELYSNSLFDTIYDSVTDLKYDTVDYPELPTDTLKARLKALNSKTPFNIAYNPALESVIKSYLKNRRNTLQRLMALSEYYFPMFEKELDNYDIPLEVKYLAIVESALKPRAKSRVGASGLCSKQVKCTDLT